MAERKIPILFGAVEDVPRNAKLLWEATLEDILGSKVSAVRPELVNNLRGVLRSQKSDAHNFAVNHVGVPKWEDTQSSGIRNEVRESRLLGYYTAAVFFANLKYYRAGFNEDKERIELNCHGRTGFAIYLNQGDHKHEIHLPPNRFDSWDWLLFALDAETRHAIHDNFLYDQESIPGRRCARAFSVVTETIDEGRIGDVDQMVYHLDPFLNDFSMAKGEESGHYGAKYFCKHLLKSDSEQRRMQLCWLARQLIRNKPKLDSEDFKLMEVLLKELTFDKGDGEQLYADGLSPLLDFYLDAPISNSQISRLHRVRSSALEHLPYQPDDVVWLGNKKLTKFASQLDYLALKLRQVDPKTLYKKAGL